MRAKLDENLGARGAALLASAGWDVATVVGQGLCTAPDAALAEACRTEGRALITLDVGFANTLRFRPSDYPGIIVLRLPTPLTLAVIEDALRRVASLATSRSPTGHLWVVDERRIREFIGADEP